MFVILAAGERSNAFFLIVSHKLIEKKNEFLAVKVYMWICKLVYKDDIRVNVTIVDGIPI